MAKGALKKQIEDDVLGSKLVLTAYRTMRFVEISVEAFGLTYHTYLILYFADKIPRVSVKELTNLLDISQPIISRTVSQLESKGWVGKHVGNDRRLIEINLTGSGRKVLRNAQAKVHEVSFMMRHQQDFRLQNALEHLDKIVSGIETAKERPLIYSKTSDSEGEAVIVKIGNQLKGFVSSRS